ncbi:MAG: ankyrin repeat domain-containing protein [Planctomycetaceae bacterium]
MSESAAQTDSAPTSRVSIQSVTTVAVLVLAAVVILISGFLPAYQSWLADRATETLLRCCRSGDVQAAQSALADGADCNAADKQGQRAISVAIESGHEQVVELLLDAGVDPLGSGTNGPLFTAVSSGQPSCVGLLVQYGADPNSAGNRGVPPLEVAIRKGDVQSAEALIEAGADIGDSLSVTVQAADQISTEAEMTRMLLRHGAVVSQSDDGETLMEALGYSNGEVADVLIEHGVTYTVTAAIALNRIDDVRRMIQDDPSLLTSTAEDAPGGNRTGTSLLCEALVRGRREIAMWLIDAGALSDSAAVPECSLMNIAASHGDAEMVRLLLSHGLDPNEPDESGLAALPWASGPDRAGVIEALIEGGADVNGLLPTGGPLLLRAARQRDLELVNLLLAHGADPTIADPITGNLAVDLARWSHYHGEPAHPEIVQVLEDSMKQRGAAISEP